MDKFFTLLEINPELTRLTFLFEVGEHSKQYVIQLNDLTSRAALLVEIRKQLDAFEADIIRRESRRLQTIADNIKAFIGTRFQVAVGGGITPAPLPPTPPGE